MKNRKNAKTPVRGIKRETLEVRLDPLEKRSFKSAADLAGIDLSAWVRERLRRAARQELEEAGLPIPFLEHVLKELQNGEISR